MCITLQSKFARCCSLKFCNSCSCGTSCVSSHLAMSASPLAGAAAFVEEWAVVWAVEEWAVAVAWEAAVEWEAAEWAVVWAAAVEWAAA